MRLGAGVVRPAQPLLGRAADVWGYPVSHVSSAGLQLFPIPFLWFARREAADADVIDRS